MAKKPKKKVTINKKERLRVETSEASVKHTSFKLSAVPKIDNSGLPSSLSLLWSTLKDTYNYRWRTFFFVLSYGLPWYFMTVQAGEKSADAAYGVFFSVIAMLASIWMVRHREAGDKVTVRGAYYRGMTQFIPFFLVLIALTIQLLPAYLGFAFYETISASGAVVTGIELLVPIAVWLFLGSLSLYWMVAGLMSLFVVTIPGTLPVQALRSGRRMVDGRRWFVLRRLIIFGGFIALLYLGFVYWFAYYQWNEALRQLSIVFPIVIIPFVNAYLYKIYSGLLSKNK